MVYYGIKISRYEWCEMSGTKITDWDLYYRKPFLTAALLRQHTSGRLIRALKKYTGLHADQPLRILEFGGGNSSFAHAVTANFNCMQYCVADTNQNSISLFQQQNLPCPANGVVHDVLTSFPDHNFDLVFSAGLIEHFSLKNTAIAIQNHFDALKPGGIAAFLFPADSILYRTVRNLAEWTGQWRFPDERPLTAHEVKSAANGHTLIHEEWIRCILLTQMLMIFRKDV